MKKTIVLSAFFALIMSMTATAQNTPKVDTRQQVQRERIKDGVKDGELTKPEATKLRVQQKAVRKAERRTKADGQVTARERRRLDKMQDRASRDIHRQKNDNQKRGGN